MFAWFCSYHSTYSYQKSTKILRASKVTRVDQASGTVSPWWTSQNPPFKVVLGAWCTGGVRLKRNGSAHGAIPSVAQHITGPCNQLAWHQWTDCTKAVLCIFCISESRESWIVHQRCVNMCEAGFARTHTHTREGRLLLVVLFLGFLGFLLFGFLLFLKATMLELLEVDGTWTTACNVKRTHLRNLGGWAIPNWETAHLSSPALRPWPYNASAHVLVMLVIGACTARRHVLGHYKGVHEGLPIWRTQSCRSVSNRFQTVHRRHLSMAGSLVRIYIFLALLHKDRHIVDVARTTFLV